MNDDRPDHQELEEVFQTRPQAVLDRLPDTTEARSAKRHLDLAYDYVVEAREKVKPA